MDEYCSQLQLSRSEVKGQMSQSITHLPIQLRQSAHDSTSDPCVLFLTKINYGIN